MAQRTCQIDGCGKPVLARNWCNGHYRRWCKHGDPHGGRPKLWAAQAQCTIQGCTSPARRRGWCGKHYKRWYVHGDPEHETPKYEACTVDDCERPTRSATATLCETHYYRLRRTGSLVLTSRRIPAPTYRAAHTRVAVDRGKAKHHRCADCGEQAGHWSFAWRRVPAEDWMWEFVNGTALAYSGEPEDYDARCHRCARHYDADFAQAGWRIARREQATP